MKYKLIMFGCQMNKSDAERVAAVLEEIGYKKTDELNQADLAVVVACSVRQSAVDRIYGLKRKFEQIKKLRPVVTVLTGCVLASDKPKMLNFFDAVIKIEEIGRLECLLVRRPTGSVQVAKHQQAARVKGKDYLSIPPLSASNFQAYVPIANGCNNFCAYCVVPYVRGREVSREAKEVLAECRKLVENCYQEITLLGQNVNSYHDGKINFPQLLKRVDNIPGNYWLRFVTSHPKDLSDELIKVMAEGKHIAPYLHLPVQSGDNQILKKMNRQYSVEHYKNLIRKVRQAIPGVTISTDVIVGFPGETRAQFQNTVKLFCEVKFDLAYIAQYSVRPGTAAAKLTDDVPQKEKARRLKVLTEILKQTALENNQKLIGQTVTVLVENCKEGFCFGKTAGFKTVKFAGDEKLVGRFVKVKIEKAGAWGLSGEMRILPSFRTGLAGFSPHGQLPPEADQPSAEKLPNPPLKWGRKTGKVVVICGTTASGKTKLAVRLAKKFNGEIISADSRQVYKGMDVGTGKDLEEYVILSQKSPPGADPPLAEKVPARGWSASGGKNQNNKSKFKNIKIPYHLIDTASPKKQYTVAEFQRDCYAAIEDVLSRGRVPIICGGTGLYIDAVVKGFAFSKKVTSYHSAPSSWPRGKLQVTKNKLNKKSLKQLLALLKKIDLKTYRIIDKQNRRRVQRALEIFYETGAPKSELPKQKKPPYEFLQLGLTFPKEVLAKRIAKRLDARFQQGMINEVKKLRQTGVSWKRLDDFGLEYRWISRYLRGKISKEEMNAELFKAIKNFSKRQLTWFRRNKNIFWIKNFKEAEKMVEKFLPTDLST